MASADTQPASAPEVSRRDSILAAARHEFARRGFAGARLQDIGDRAGVRHPTLLYHFGSKEDLYRAVIAAAAADWAAETRVAISSGLTGFEQVSSLIDAGFRFFERNRDFIRIVRRETIEGGDRLEGAIAQHMRPFLDDAREFLERETAAGRLRPHDPVAVIQLCYGAISTYFSEASFVAKLLDEDPLEPAALRRHRDSLKAILKPALEA